MRVVIPSLGYADFLADTLPAWRELLPAADFIVVTGPADSRTQAVARLARARCVVTTAWTDGPAVFNKAGALDQGFGFGTEHGRPAAGEVCLTLDADVYPVGRWPGDAAVHEGTIHGSARHLCRTREELERYRDGTLAASSFPLIRPRSSGQVVPELVSAPIDIECDNAARRAIGYCQAFRYRPGLAYGWSSTAGGCDNAFARQFPRRGLLPGLSVLHLGTPDRENWRGRTVPAWTSA